MVRATTAVFLVWFTTTIASAQKAELLKGKWEFKDIANKEQLDATILQQATFSFRSTEIEFITGGKLTYNPFSANALTKFTGTWVLNKEQTKVSAVLANPKTNQEQKAEWDIAGLTKDELKLNMGNNAIIAFRRPVEKPVELTGLYKTCDIEFFTKLAIAVKNKDIETVKSAAKNSLSITGYTEGEKKTNRSGEIYTELISNEKFGLLEVPFKISKYENGEIGVYRSMTREEINFTREALKKAEATNKGWKSKGTDGFWEYWEYGEVVFWFSGRENGSGSDSDIYTKKQIGMK